MFEIVVGSALTVVTGLVAWVGYGLDRRINHLESSSQEKGEALARLDVSVRNIEGSLAYLRDRVDYIVTSMPKRRGD